MSTKAARGTKRTCQNSECASRFYDLNRETIICPVCQSVFVPVVQAAHVETAAPVDEKLARREHPIDGEVEVVDGELPVVEGEEVIADLEAVEPAAAAEGVEAFLEEEEEGGDVSNILGSPVEGEPEET